MAATYLPDPHFPDDGFEPTMQLRYCDRLVPIKYYEEGDVAMVGEQRFLQQLWTRSDGTWVWRDIPIVNEEKP